MIETTDVVVLDAALPDEQVEADQEPAVIVQIDDAWLELIDMTNEVTND